MMCRKRLLCLLFVYNLKSTLQTVQTSSENHRDFTNMSTISLNSSDSKQKLSAPTKDLQEPKRCDGDNYFVCEENEEQCVPLTAKCNGFPDCRDASDEKTDFCGCLPHEFSCNGTCIDSIRRCNTVIDCDDAVDEHNCESFGCASSHFKCDNYFCVPNEKVCDYVNDCGDNSDEKQCSFRRCWYGEYTCSNGQCIKLHDVCNGVPDCVDNSDELQCDPSKHFVRCDDGSKVHISLWCDNWTDCTDNHFDELNCRNCSENEFKCNNSRCISKANVCDGQCDCVSGCEDEVNCENASYVINKGIVLCNKQKSLRCYMSDRCIAKDFICNGVNDCVTGNRTSNDELGCGISYDECFEERKLWCSEGRCLPAKFKCNHIVDCLDGSDEENCQFPSCSEEHFKCQSGECIPRKHMCDLIPDCADKSDEIYCEIYACPDEHFKCSTGQCVPNHRVCDWRNDCPQGDDEQNCEAPKSKCGNDEFRCRNGQCVPALNRCYFSGNSRNGCADNSHLQECSEHECGVSQIKCKGSYCIDKSLRCDGKVDCRDSWTDEEGCPFQCSSEAKCPCIDILINCSSLGIESIPQKIENEISRLVFANNKIGKNLRNSTFKGLERAQILDLSNNEITEIPPFLFENLWQLKILYLNANRIDTIGENTFSGLSSLRSLVIKENRMKNIEAMGFNGMSSLKSLDLSHQMLENISRNAFLGLRALVNLDLSNNNLKTLEEGVFNGLSALIHLDLSQNKFNIIAPRVFHGLTSLTTLMTDEFKFCCLAHHSTQCYPEPDEFSSCEDLMSNIVLRFCIWVLGVIAFFGNVLVLIWRVFNRASNRVHSFLISNLALGDLLMGVYLMIIAGVDFYYRGVYIAYDDFWRRNALCKLSGFLSTLSSESSVFTLTVITVDRFVSIVFPFRLKRMQLHQTVIIIIGIWLVCVCIAGIPLLNIDYFKNFYGRSGVCLALHITHQRPSGWEYSVFVYLVVNLISLTIIAFAYTWMFFVAQSSRRAVRTFNKSKNDSTMAKRIMIIIFTDFFCWMPIITLGFLSLANIKIPPQVFAWIAVFILPLNAALNPVIYTLSTPLFLGGAKRGMSTFQASVLHSDTQRSFIDRLPSQHKRDFKNRKRKNQRVVFGDETLDENCDTKRFESPNPSKSRWNCNSTLFTSFSRKRKSKLIVTANESNDVNRNAQVSNDNCNHFQSHRHKRSDNLFSRNIETTQV